MAANFPGAGNAVPAVYGPTGSYMSVNDMGHSPVMRLDSNRKGILLDGTHQDVYTEECSKCGCELRVYIRNGNVTDIQQYMKWSYSDNDVEKPQHCNVLRMESAIG